MIRDDAQKSLIERAAFHGRHAALEASEVSFAGGEVNFADRFRDALRRRLQPHTVLHVKQLAHAIGKSDRAVQMVMAGNIGLHSETVAACIAFFWRQGDRAFIAEIYGLPVLMPVGEAIQPVVDAYEMLGDILNRRTA